jgi:hypothetical protein
MPEVGPMNRLLVIIAFCLVVQPAWAEPRFRLGRLACDGAAAAP